VALERDVALGEVVRERLGATRTFLRAIRRGDDPDFLRIGAGRSREVEKAVLVTQLPKGFGLDARRMLVPHEICEHGDCDGDNDFDVH
jgi:hypothetical protein